MTDQTPHRIFALVTLLAFLPAHSPGQAPAPAPEEPPYSLLKTLTEHATGGASHFGSSVAISGPLVVVGSPRDNDLGPDSGSVHLFDKDLGGPQSWGRVRQLNIPGPGSFFGASVDVDGDTLVVGSPGEHSFTGAAYIFERNCGGEDNWGLAFPLIPDPNEGQYFGFATAVSGDTVVVGAPLGSEVYVYQRHPENPCEWTFQKQIARNVIYRFGASLDIFEDTLVVGAPKSPSVVYIFGRNIGGDNNWGPATFLQRERSTNFGTGVALHGDTLVVGGAPNFVHPGDVYVFDRHHGGPDSWGEVKKFSPLGYHPSDQLTGAVSIHGDLAVVSGLVDSVATSFVLQRNEGGANNWGVIQEITTGPTYDLRPVAAVDGEHIVAGANGDLAGAGAAYIFGERDKEPPTAEVLAPAGGEYWQLSESNASPDLQLVVWEMADNLRVCQVAVSLLFSNDGGASYQPAPAGGLPAIFGPGGPCESPGESTKSLIFEIPESPPSGNAGSLYKIQVQVTDPAGNVTRATSPNPFFMVQVDPDPKTLIVAHPLRMQAQMGLSDVEVAALRLKLEDLANHPDVEGLIVDLGGITDLQALYAAWDADPDLANPVLFGCHRDEPEDPLPVGCSAERRGIHDTVRELLETYPGVENLILVGDDRIIPMARVADRTDLFPENRYTSDDPADLQAELSTHGTTVGHALEAKLYLSDDPLATRGRVRLAELREEGHTFLPQLAVGRLVETPEEIAASIATFISQDGVLDLEAAGPNKVQVTAYDFLVDAGKKIHRRWLGTLGVADLLSGQTWTENDLLSKLCTLDGVANLNGHATHYEEGVPGGGIFTIQGLDTAEMLAADACGERRLELNGRVIYAVGCHGGLPVAGSTVPSDPQLDLPQALLSRGVMAYLANSGYGWGLRWGVGYSERLVELFTEELTRGGTVVLGEAVKNAKLRYYLESPRFDAYSEKTLMQWTFFGFPMYALKTGIPEEPEPDSLLQPAAKHRDVREELGAVTVERREMSRDVAAKVELPDYLTQVNLRFNLSAVGVYEKYKASGDVEPGVGCSDPNGCYYTLNGLVEWETGTADLPLQPFLVYDSRLSGTSQHGVLWKGGAYDAEDSFLPVFAELISNGGDGSDHGVLPRKIYRKPRWPRRRLFGGNADCRATDLEVSSIVLTTGESVLGPDGTFSIQRLYRDIDLEAFYFNNPQDPQQNCDRTGPVLGSGPHHQASGTRVDWVVAPSDDSGIWRVVAVYDDESRQRWIPVELEDDGTGTWRGHAIMGSAGTVSYFLQAVDRRGNVSWLDYESPQPPVSAAPLSLPQPVDVQITPGQADLAVTLVDFPDPARPGDTVFYTAVVENLGPDPASRVTLSATLSSDVTQSSGATFVEASGRGWSCASAGETLLCQQESVDVGPAPVLSLVTVAPNGRAASLTAHVSAGETDPHSSNNSATEETTLIDNSQVDVEITLEGQLFEGSVRRAVYTLTVINHGPGIANEATVVDHFPQGLAAVEWTCRATAGATCTASGTGDIVDVVSLPPGGRVQYTASADLLPGITGDLENTAVVNLPGDVDDRDLTDNRSSSRLDTDPPAESEIFCDGFESGDLSGWSSFEASPTTDPSRRGDRE